MYIRLTRTDGAPIWINASFIVTIEPQKNGTGSVVVPVGDGLDYDVKEPPETVLGLLDGAPASAAMPIPTSDVLTTAPYDVSPEDGPLEESLPSPAQTGKTAKRQNAKTATAKAKPSAAMADDPTPKPGRRKKTSKTEEKSPAKRKDAPAIDETQLERLRKLAPKSLKKLKNTLSSQFKIEDIDAAVESLVRAGAFSLDAERVVWTARSGDGIIEADPV